jgi:hypothetical protein
MANKRNLYWLWVQRVFNGVFSGALVAISGTLWLDEPSGSWRHFISLCLLWASIPTGIFFAAITRRFSLVTGLLGETIGRLNRWSEEHRKFLRAGLVCQNCKQMLIGKWGMTGVNCYDSKGERIPPIQTRRKGWYAECPNCLHRWQFRQSRDPSTVDAEQTAATK